jgi:hypothetical protein
MKHPSKRTGFVLAACLVLSLAPATTARVTGDGFRSVRLPSRPGAGEPVEERVLLDDAHMKLVAITLRRGAELPERVYPAATTIQALHGSGRVRFSDDEGAAIGPGRMLALDAGKRHSVRPGTYGYLVLLIQHTKSARSSLP